MPCADAEMMNSGAAGHDVDDGIHRAHLMEVDLIDRNVVNFGLRVPQQLEGPDCQILDRRIERSSLNQSADRGERSAMDMGRVLTVIVAVVMIVPGLEHSCRTVRVSVPGGGSRVMSVTVRVARLVLMLRLRLRHTLELAPGVLIQRTAVLRGAGPAVPVNGSNRRGIMTVAITVHMGVAGLCLFGEAAILQHVHFGGRDATAIHGFDLQARAQVERGSGVMQNIGGYTGIKQRSEKHVSRDAGKTIKIRNTHRVVSTSSWLPLYDARRGRTETRIGQQQQRRLDRLHEPRCRAARTGDADECPDRKDACDGSGETLISRGLPASAPRTLRR